MNDQDTQIYARRWWTLGVLCLSLLIVFVGNSSLNVTIPTLSRQFHATESQLQWVVASYSLVFAGLLFTAGAIGDRFGRKGALQVGLLGFLACAALASLSTQMWQLIACRALMGACAAFIMPSTLSILVNIFPPEERSRAIAIWAGITGGAGALGPVASGWLLGHYWVGSVFLVNVPIVLIALLLGAFLVPRSRDPQEGRLDPVGAALSAVGISSLVYGLIQAPEKGWASPESLVAFGLGAAVVAAFVAWEHRQEEPMLDMSYFRNPAFSTATGGMVLVFLSMYGVMFLITQYFQLVLGFSPLSAAMRFLPIAPIMMLLSPQTPRISGRFGANRTVSMGMGLVAVAFLGFTTLGQHTSYAFVLVCVVFLVTGIALTTSPMTASIMSAVPPRRAGAGSAMNDATRELGSALGVAILGSIAASRYSRGLASSLGSLSSADRTVAKGSLAGAIQAAPHLTGTAGTRLISAANTAFMSGIHLAALTGAILAGTASMIVLRFLPREVTHEGAMHDGLSSLENTLELTIAGGMPVFADLPLRDQAPVPPPT